VKVAALELGLPVLQPKKVKTPEFAEELKAYQAQGICVVAYGRILSKEVIEATPWGCINVHFSLLPKYRGAACVAYALINGDEETGVSTMLIDEGLDTGPILQQWTEPIQADDTTETLSGRLADLGAQQLVKSIQGLEVGNLKPVPQAESGISLAPLLKKEQGHVDWSQPAEKIYNLYRGLTPWPGIYSFLGERRILLTQVQKAEGPAQGEAGSLEINAEGLWVNCGEGRLKVLQLKPEGKKVLSAQEFMRGLQSKEGLRFR